MPFVIVSSLAAALMFAIAAVAQQYKASAESDELNLRLRLVLRLARQPVWVLGVCASVGGYAFQALALDRGTLVTVQPIMVAGLVFALPMSAATIHRRWLSAQEWLATIAVSGGLALFVVVAHPATGVPDAGGRAWIAIGASAIVTTGVLLWVSRHAHGAGRNVLQATAAGVTNGLAAAFIKTDMHVVIDAWRVHRGILYVAQRALATWQCYALVAAYLTILLLVQSAFQGGPIGWSLPALTVANPVAALVIGVAGFGEHISGSPAAIAAEAFGLALVVWGVRALARSPLMPALSARSSAAARVPAASAPGP